MFEVILKGELRNVTMNEFKKRDGSDGVGYNVLVEGLTGTKLFPTTVEVYNAFVQGKIKKADICEFDCVYNPNYKFNQLEVQGVRVK